MKIISFGYLHGPPPTAHVTIDLRNLLHDPSIDLVMRTMTGLSQRVYDSVMGQPEAVRLVRALASSARVLDAITPDAVIAIGCSGGRHRSVAFARALTVELRDVLRIVATEHRDIEKPAVTRPSLAGAS